MKTLKIDDNNNLILDKYGNIEVLTDIEAVCQDTKTMLGLCYGENPFNVDEGIDYDTDFIGNYNNENEDYLKSLVRSRLLNHSEILAIEKVELTKEQETIKINTTIKTIYGDANV